MVTTFIPTPLSIYLISVIGSLKILLIMLVVCMLFTLLLDEVYGRFGFEFDTKMMIFKLILFGMFIISLVPSERVMIAMIISNNLTFHEGWVDPSIFNKLIDMIK